jgi:hypothetical protein
MPTWSPCPSWFDRSGSGLLIFARHAQSFNTSILFCRCAGLWREE